MSVPARSFASFFRPKPLSSQQTREQIQQFRDIVDHTSLHRLRPALDALVDRSRALHPTGPHPLDGDRQEALAQHLAITAIADPLTHIADRLQHHLAHPGVAALQARCMPHGLHHLLSLPAASMVHELRTVVAQLLSPAHQPYVHTARLGPAVGALASGLLHLEQLTRHPHLPRRAEDMLRAELQQELVLLLLRGLAICWSDHPAHVRGRHDLLPLWEACLERSDDDSATAAAAGPASSRSKPPPDSAPLRMGPPPVRPAGRPADAAMSARRGTG